MSKNEACHTTPRSGNYSNIIDFQQQLTLPYKPSHAKHHYKASYELK